MAACSGDSTTTDGGTDATTDTGGPDTSKVDSGGTDSGGTDSSTDGGGTDGSTDGGGTDGGGTDGGTDSGIDGGSFACGSVTCDSNTQYCTKTLTGLDSGVPDAAKINDASVIADSGQMEIDQCQTYPTSCTADGGTPNCTCTQGNCGSCSQSGPDITVLCP